MTQQLKGLGWLILTLGIGIFFAMGLPYFAAWVPWSVEKKAALYLDFSAAEVCQPGQAQASASLEQLVQRLYPIYPKDHSFPLTVQIIRGDTINAFAGLAGHVYIYDGLLQGAQSPDELAGILAHEMEHVRHRHIMQTLFVRLSTIGALQLLFTNGRTMGSELTRMLLNSRFSRDQEHEADLEGLKRLAKAHINGNGFVQFFERARASATFPSFLSDHPDDADRAALARQYASGPSVPILSKAAWNSLKGSCH